MDYRQVIDRLRGFFDGRSARFAVVGGIALGAYGRARATFDLDIVTDATVQDDLVRFLEDGGYETVHRSDGYSNHIHEEDALGSVDVIYVRGETGRALFAGAREEDVLPGIRALVPRPEHLIAMKVHAMANDPGRAFEEMSDIGHLMRLPGVDRDEVREAFATRGLLERYRKLERALGRER